MIIISIEQIMTFFLVFARMVSIMTYAPVFSNKEIFVLAKVTLTFWISMLTIFFIPLPIEFPQTVFAFILAIIIELLLGALIGFVTQLFVTAVSLGGALMDTQAGLSVASLLDPSQGVQTTIISRWTTLLALLIFLIIDGHHILFSILIQSFRAIPIASPFVLDKAIPYVIEASVTIFATGLQISAPILLVVFLIDFGFGMLSRVAPQVNVFQLGFQMKPLISMMVFLTIIPGFVDLFYYILEQISNHLLKVLFLLRL